METGRTSLARSILDTCTRGAPPLSTRCQTWLHVALFGIVAVILLMLFEALNVPEVALGFIAALASYAMPSFKMNAKAAAIAPCAKVTAAAPTSSNLGAADRAGQPRVRGGASSPVAGASRARTPSTASTEDRSTSPCRAPADPWDQQIEGMLRQIARTSECVQVVQRIALEAQRAIQLKCPDARVSGYALGNPVAGKAFGVAVPEVELVVTASPDALTRWLNMPFLKHGEGETPLEELHLKFNKAAIRACAKQLASTRQFKFRRTQLSVEDPRITMLVPATVAGSCSSVAVDIGVNAVTPPRMAILLAECTRIDQRARDLMLLVKEWARNRGIAHKGSSQLSPYGWMLLTIYYLQVAGGRNGFRFPPVQELKRVAGEKIQATRERHVPSGGSDRAPSSQSLALLLRGFIEFYCNTFDWNLEAVCPRLGRRWNQGISLQPFLDPATEGALHVEDPFEPSRNVAARMPASSLSRMMEELQRANTICKSGDAGSFARLFETILPSTVAGSSDDWR